MDTDLIIQEIRSSVEAVAIQVQWRTVAPDYEGSERDSRVPGDTGFDIAGVREWEPGLKLDYLLTARTGWREKLSIEWEQPRQLTVAVLVKESPSIAYGVVNQTKQKLAATLVAWVLTGASALCDLAGYGIWSEKGVKRFSRPRPAAKQIYPLLETYIEDPGMVEEPYENGAASLASLVERLPTNRKCLVFVISDGLSAEELKALDAASEHDVVVLAVGDLRERELPEGTGFREIQDINTGKTITVLLNERTRQKWREAFDKQRSDLRTGLDGLGMSMEEFFTHEDEPEFKEKLLPILGGHRPRDKG
jgi:hypothetical protein